MSETSRYLLITNSNRVVGGMMSMIGLRQDGIGRVDAEHRVVQ